MHLRESSTQLYDLFLWCLILATMLGLIYCRASAAGMHVEILFKDVFLCSCIWYLQAKRALFYSQSSQKESYVLGTYEQTHSTVCLEVLTALSLMNSLSQMKDTC